MGEKKNYFIGKEQIFELINLDSDGLVGALWKLCMCNNHQDRIAIDIIRF